MRRPSCETRRDVTCPLGLESTTCTPHRVRTFAPPPMLSSTRLAPGALRARTRVPSGPSCTRHAPVTWSITTTTTPSDPAWAAASAARGPCRSQLRHVYGYVLLLPPRPRPLPVQPPIGDRTRRRLLLCTHSRSCASGRAVPSAMDETGMICASCMLASACSLVVVAIARGDSGRWRHGAHDGQKARMSAVWIECSRPKPRECASTTAPTLSRSASSCERTRAVLSASADVAAPPRRPPRAA